MHSRQDGGAWWSGPEARGSSEKMSSPGRMSLAATTYLNGFPKFVKKHCHFSIFLPPHPLLVLDHEREGLPRVLPVILLILVLLHRVLVPAAVLYEERNQSFPT